ncbi:phage tail tape measure protein [Tepidibacter thalassicus]|uniref:Phage tail tape measure protein, TP901 family, core region n=1 Tax=Tepidibacter thalassicus DSM 15285 TaxID=1123350 RepID=A0A1M5PWE6_9FIRM|nr:phage tail tape measure protein [Tepidibacter thalassicus]SHH05841.1 phage tail tape measure protein, TP901 family, core region [Tepidibacter thalassicus DSM 15285]
MAEVGSLVVRVGMDSTGFNTSISKLNRQLRVVQSEFQAASVKLGNFGNSTEQLRLKAESLNKQIDIQSQKVEVLRRKYEESLRTKGADNKATQNLAIQYNRAQAELSRLENELRETNNTIEQQTNRCTKLDRQLQVVQSEFKNASSALSGFGSSTDKLKVKADYLNKSIDLQKQKVQALKEAFEKSKETKGTDAKATQNLAIQYNNAQTKLNYLERDLKKVNDDIRIQENRWIQLGNKLKAVGTKMQNVGKKMQDVGKSLTTVTMPLVGIGAASVKTAMDFESAMSEVQAISGATGDDLEALKDKALEMGSTTKFSASQSAEALKYMSMAGWKTEQMLDGLSGVMNLAAASGEDLATVSDIVTDAMTAFGMKANEANDFADLLAATSSNANTNVSMLGESFKYVAPVAGSLGYTAKETALALGLMANAGIKASNSGTALRSIMTRLVKPTKESGTAMDMLGITIKDATTGKMKPFIQIMEELREKFKDLTPDQQAFYAAQIAGKEAMSGLLAIVNASEKDYMKLASAIEESKGKAKEMAKTMQDNLQGQLTKLKSALEGAAISIGETLMPMITKLVAKIQEWTDKFNSLSPAQQELIVKIGLLVAAIGPILLIFGQFAGAIGNVMLVGGKLITHWGSISSAATKFAGFLKPLLGGLFSPWGLAIAGAVVAGYLIIKNWDKIKEGAKKLKEFLSKKFNDIKESISNKWNQVKEKTTSTWNNIKTSTSEAWGNIQTTVKSKISGVFDNVKDKMNSIKSTMSEKWNSMKENTSQTWQIIRSKINEHGGGIKGVIGTYTEIYKTVWENTFNVLDKITGGKMSSISNTISQSVNNIKTKMINTWSNIKNSLTETWNNLKSKASNIFRDIARAIVRPFKNIHIPTPHFDFSVSHREIAGVSIPVPKVHVNWYAKGGIFNRPSVIGVGEAGTEAVLPIDRLDDILARALKKVGDKSFNSESATSSGITLHIENFYNNADKDIEQLAYELEFYRQRVTMGRGGK